MNDNFLACHFVGKDIILEYLEYINYIKYLLGLGCELN